MKEITEVIMLLDFYGNLLTEKQQLIMKYHYEDDMSLGEISEELGISRQAVHDIVKRSEKILENYEDKLMLIDRFERQKQSLLNIKRILEEKKLDRDMDKIIKILDDLIYI